MFDTIGHGVVKLRRVAIGFLLDEGLKPGEFRLLDEREVRRFFRLWQSPRQRPAKKRNKPPADSRN
jgi:23S rRNA pseudouridine2605 synthase